MKKCTQCQELKDFRDYHKNSRNKSGYVERCKECVSLHTRKYYLNNATIVKNKASKRYEKDAPKHLNRVLQYAKLNREVCNAASKRYRIKQRQLNPAYYTEISMRHYACKMQRMPKWLSKEQRKDIKEIYRKARERNLVVDHVVPLRGVNVSGLHVPWNLQLLTEQENRTKSNHF